MREFAIATSPRRPGFTLVEMLVVLTLILILASITVAFMPRFQEKQKTARAADQLQGWLLIAKSLAKRDRTSTGIRLQPSRANANYSSEMQYIQQPEDYVVQPGLNAGDPPNIRRIQVVDDLSRMGMPPVYRKVRLETPTA